MEQVGKNIYLEDSYTGVVLGAIKLEHGLLLVDSPLRSSDQRSWRDQASQLGDGIDRFALMLDTHIDRTLGLTGLDGSVLGHERVEEILSGRPTALRPQVIEPGSEAEALEPLAAVRWPTPHMTFSNKLALYTDEGTVTISHQPGAHTAGCWVRLDGEGIVFVGDSAVVHQPPFLAWSDLDIWLDELAELQTEPLKDYRIISSRNGWVHKKAIEKLVDFLLSVNERLPDLTAQENREDAIADLVPVLLRKISFNKQYINLYRKRLAHGLAVYLKRHDALDKVSK